MFTSKESHLLLSLFLVISLRAFQVDSFTQCCPRLCHKMCWASKFHVVNIHYEELLSSVVPVSTGPIIRNRLESCLETLFITKTLPESTRVLVTVQRFFQPEYGASHLEHFRCPQLFWKNYIRRRTFHVGLQICLFDVPSFY